MTGSETRALILGGTGFIGSNLVRHLVENGIEVIVIHRKNADLGNLSGIVCQKIIGDLMDSVELPAILEKALAGCQVIYNLAACGTSLKRDEHLRNQVNVVAARIVARAARRVGSLRLVHISSSAAVGFPFYGETADETFEFNAPTNHYSVTKRQGEKEILSEVEKGLDAVIAIPCSTLGAHGTKPHQLDLFKNTAAGKARTYPAGGLCLTNIKDLVKGLVLCYEKGKTGKRYILGGHNITYKQYFNAIAQATGGKAPNIRLPKTILPWLGLGVDMLSRVLKRENTIDWHVGKMIGHNLFYSSSMARKDLGYTIRDWQKTVNEVVKEMRDKNLV